MMRLFRYNVEFQYTPGKFLYIADTLSRAYLTENASTPNIMHVVTSQDLDDQMIKEMQQATF